MEARRPIKVNEAITTVLNHKQTGKIVYVPIEKSYGRYLGEDLIADHHVPPFDRSPYDGFAVRSKDTTGADRNNPVTFEVVGHIGAGSVFEGTVGKNQAVRIMTGAQMPEECDAVVMLELAEEMTENDKPFFQLKREHEAGKNVSFTGEDTKKGEVLVQKGAYINPGIVASLATFGYKRVPVTAKPKVGIIATGSELLAIDEPLKPGKIRNSNASMVHAQLLRAGADPVYFGQFSDDFENCYEQVERALEEVDFLITTGGVSVGDFDYLPAIYEKLNAEVLFNKVAMRPGSVTTVAQKNGKLLFGLSGNPSACYVGMELFVRPAVRAYLDASGIALKRETVILGETFSKANPFHRFVRGHLSFEDGKLVATPVGLDKSNVVSSLADANVLIVLPGGTRGYEKGMEATAILLEDQEGAPIEDFTRFEMEQKERE